MKKVVILFCAVACGGSSASTPTQTPAASASGAPSASAAPSAAPSEELAPNVGPPGHHHERFGSGWFLSGNARADYQAQMAGDMVNVHPRGDTHNRYVTLMKNLDATPYIGRKLKVTVIVRTEGMTTQWRVWARTRARGDAEDAPSAAETVLETHDATHSYEVTFQVKEGARWIQYGVGIAGPGQFWVGKDSLEIVP